MFNLSFLDLLSGALGAVIFLFIITPKGGQSPAKTQQAVVTLDTTHNQLFGGLHDSLLHKTIGDTLLVLIGGFDKMPSIEDCPECPPPIECPARRPCPEQKPCPACPECPGKTTTEPIAGRNGGGTQVMPVNNPPATHSDAAHTTGGSDYKGDPPAVPCNVSFEINWRDIDDNVDLIVCKNGDCINGRKRKNKDIGQWSSGITPTNIFGTDFRTTQEGVRQFREIIPGKYTLKAVYKDSKKGHQQIEIVGLIYTKNMEGKEQGKRFSKTLTLDPRKEVNLGTVELKENGAFIFKQN